MINGNYWPLFMLQNFGITLKLDSTGLLSTEEVTKAGAFAAPLWSDHQV